jgi:hypothetical protein
LSKINKNNVKRENGFKTEAERRFKNGDKLKCAKYRKFFFLLQHFGDGGPKKSIAT